MTAELPKVRIIDPPVPLPVGITLPPLLRVSGKASREVRIPLYCDNAFRAMWKSYKLAFHQRGFCIVQHNGAWHLQQRLLGYPGNWTLTAVGAEQLAALLAPRKAAAQAMEVPAEFILPELPDGLEGKLFEYQRQPARQLYRALCCGKEEWGYPGAWDCSDMGVGKTFQSLAAALATGLEVGVVCPKAVIGSAKGKSGWLGAFAHFGQHPAFVINYESLRTGGKAILKKTGIKGRPFEWSMDPDHVMLIWDEAHNCFPASTLIETRDGALSIGEIVNNHLKIQVKTVDLETGRTTFRNVLSHFKNPSGRLIRIVHERGYFTCTGNHKIWTSKGWRAAETLDQGDQLLALRNSNIPELQKSHETILREKLHDEIQNAHLRSGEKEGMASESHCHPGVCSSPRFDSLPAMRDTIPSQIQEKIPVRKFMCCNISNDSSWEERIRREIDDEFKQKNVGFGKKDRFQTDDRKQSNEECGGEGENDEITSGENVSFERREWENNEAAGSCSGTDRSPYGICHRHTNTCESVVCQSSEEIQRGPGACGIEACHRNRWEYPQIGQVEIPGQKENGDTCVSRVDRIEILECGSGCGSSGCSGEDFLYDIEVEGTHCYFANGVLVHNCKNPSLNRSMAQAAIRQGFKQIFVSGTMAAKPTNLAATGVAVGLHRGDRESYSKFLKTHGCFELSPDSWEFDRKRGIPHLARINSVVFPRRGARVKISDLGDRFPETQILCQSVSTDETKALAAAYEEVRSMLAAMAAQGKSRGEIEMIQRTAYMAVRKQSELAKVPALVVMAMEEMEAGRSVAIFLNFTEARERIMKALKTTCGIFGGQDTHPRNEAMRKFQSDESRVIVVMSSAGGTGVNLHDVNGEYPRTALICPDNNAVTLGQVLGRVHRAGGKSKSRQIIVYSEGTVEEAICDNVRQKLSNIASINDGDLNPPDKF